MPKGCAYSRPRSFALALRFETSTRIRGTNPHASNAARLSRNEALVSTAPETYANTGRGSRRRAACSKSSSERMAERDKALAVAFRDGHFTIGHGLPPLARAPLRHRGVQQRLGEPPAPRSVRPPLAGGLRGAPHELLPL